MGWVNALNTEEVATRLGISEQRVRQFCEEKRLGRKSAGRWMITEAELRAFKLRPTGRPRKKALRNLKKGDRQRGGKQTREK